MNPVSTGEVPHGRVLTSLDDMVGALVILDEVEHNVSLEDGLPQVERWDPNRAYSGVGRDHFGFHCGVCTSRLLSALGAEREAGIDAYETEEDARG